MSRKAYPKADAPFRKREHEMGLPHWIISLGLVSVAILDPDHIPAVACCYLVAVLIFFLANQSWLNFTW
jgi:hypothetical protein